MSPHSWGRPGHLRTDEDGKVRLCQKQLHVQDNEGITPLCIFGMEWEKLIEGQNPALQPKSLKVQGLFENLCIQRAKGLHNPCL